MVQCKKVEDDNFFGTDPLGIMNNCNKQNLPAVCYNNMHNLWPAGGAPGKFEFTPQLFYTILLLLFYRLLLHCIVFNLGFFDNLYIVLCFRR